MSVSTLALGSSIKCEEIAVGDLRCDGVCISEMANGGQEYCGSTVGFQRWGGVLQSISEYFRDGKWGTVAGEAPPIILGH